MTERSDQKSPDGRRFGLYSRPTTRARATLITVMLDEQAAATYADELRRALRFAVVEVKPFEAGQEIPEYIR